MKFITLCILLLLSAISSIVTQQCQTHSFEASADNAFIQAVQTAALAGERLPLTVGVRNEKSLNDALRGKLLLKLDEKVPFAIKIYSNQLLVGDQSNKLAFYAALNLEQDAVSGGAAGVQIELIHSAELLDSAPPPSSTISEVSSDASRTLSTVALLLSCWSGDVASVDVPLDCSDVDFVAVLHVSPQLWSEKIFCDSLFDEQLINVDGNSPTS
jgi:hypothetical protein